MGLPSGIGLEPVSGPVINPSGGPLCGHPLMMTGLIRLGEAFRQLSGTAGAHQVEGATRALAHATSGHCLQQNLLFVLGTERRWS
jgi:acetyl-CoA C-acetyltransferase